MWKQLFEEAPRHAVENLLSPQRKIMYGVFAFAPGTLLALYLNSVKHRMNRENEVLRQEHVSEEMMVEAAGQQKDVVLVQMIDELRERIQQLEREARDDTVTNKANNAVGVITEGALPTQRIVAEKLSKMDEKTAEPVERQRTELPSFLAEYEDTLRPWLDRFDTLATEADKLHAKVSEMIEKRNAEQKKAEEELLLKKKMEEKSPSQGIEQSGIRERIADREREMIAQDIRAYKAAAAQKPQ